MSCLNFLAKVLFREKFKNGAYMSRVILDLNYKSCIFSLFFLTFLIVCIDLGYFSLLPNLCLFF